MKKLLQTGYAGVVVLPADILIAFLLAGLAINLVNEINARSCEVFTGPPI